MFGCQTGVAEGRGPVFLQPLPDVCRVAQNVY
jgi:hypothetical protein